MGDKTGISWTDATWNPIVGCSIKSPGCINCYAMKLANRLLDKPGSHYHGTTKIVNGNAVWTGEIAMAPESILLQPIKWQRPRLIFVNSMGDLFHEKVTQAQRDLCFAVMAICSRHKFQVLTKRDEEMLEYMTALGTKAGFERLEAAARSIGYTFQFRDVSLLRWPIPNIWLGCSVEDAPRKTRIDTLRKVPAAVRFLSIEPQVGDLGEIDLTGIHWVIVGGESGPDARPFHVEWALDIQKQCQAASVPFFMKQMGGAAMHKGVSAMLRNKMGQDTTEWLPKLIQQDFPKAA